MRGEGEGLGGEEGEEEGGEGESLFQLLCCYGWSVVCAFLFVFNCVLSFVFGGNNLCTSFIFASQKCK